MSQVAPAITLAGRRRWFALAFLALGVAMIILDATIVNVAIPTMVRDLSLTTTDAEWVTAAYSLVFAALLILWGRVADRVGRKRMFVIGVVVFISASVLVAASSTSATLIAARALQGVGGAMILPASLSVINAVFTGRSRAVAFAVWGGTIGGMAALGPLVGGWLTTYASWHWAFLINVPIGLLVLAGVLVVVPETKEIDGKRGIDVLGTVLITAGMLGIVFGLIEATRYGWLKPIAPLTVGSWTWPFTSVSPVTVAIAAGAIALAVFVVVERRRGRAGKVVVVDLRLFGIRTFSAGNVAALLVSLGEFGLLFALPLFLQAAIGYDAMQTGLILTSLAIGSFVSSGVGAPLAHRIGPVRVLQIGMALEAVGILALGFAMSASISGWQMAPWLFVYGMGVGFATAQLTGVILCEVPVTESGQASAVQSTARQVGAALGTAIIGTTLVFGLGATATQLTDRGVPETTAEQVSQAVSSSAGQAIPALAGQPDGATLVDGASAAFVDAVKLVAWVAGGFVVIGLLASLAIPRNAARVESEGYAPPATEPEPEPEPSTRETT